MSYQGPLTVSEDILRCMGTPSFFSIIFTKEDNCRNFLFAFLDSKILTKKGLFIKERILS